MGRYVIKVTGGHLGEEIRYIHRSGMLCRNIKAARLFRPHPARVFIALNMMDRDLKVKMSTQYIPAPYQRMNYLFRNEILNLQS